MRKSSREKDGGRKEKEETLRHRRPTEVTLYLLL